MWVFVVSTDPEDFHRYSSHLKKSFISPTGANKVLEEHASLTSSEYVSGVLYGLLTTRRFEDTTELYPACSASLCNSDTGSGV